MKLNIIKPLADGLGFEGMQCNNLNSKIPTPRLYKLAPQGMLFTNAHAPSSVFTRSRYSILTGRYSWRTPPKPLVFWPRDSSLIEPDRIAVANLLHQ